tara:strand:+ start:4801 stop:5046 length:246 start_codon:yes stop_codon:yes gene_type:complete
MFAGSLYAHFQGAWLVKIQVNGETREVPAEFTVADLLVELALQPKYLAVERNLILIPREEHAACALQEGDRLEIVTLVGGG